MEQADILKAIIKERQRQDMLHIWNKHTNKVAIVAEEFGEVGAALQGEGSLEEELIQLAAVCIRWLESL